MPYNIKNNTFELDKRFTTQTYTGYINDPTIIHKDITKPDYAIPIEKDEFKYSTIDTKNNVGDIEIDGVSIRESLKSMNEIKKMLLILERDIDMEERYPELKEAYDNYNKILEHLQVIEKLADGPSNVE